jgi:hypothetical protein
MTNSESRCASTMTEVPDFHGEVVESARKAARLVEVNQNANAVRLFHFAAGELATGRFPNATAALEFVLDAVL